MATSLANLSIPRADNKDKSEAASSQMAQSVNLSGQLDTLYYVSLTPQQQGQEVAVRNVKQLQCTAL